MLIEFCKTNPELEEVQFTVSMTDSQSQPLVNSPIYKNRLPGHIGSPV
jgi:hypothetical protein